MEIGLILRSTGSWYEIYDTESGQVGKARLKGKLKLQGVKATNPVAVGDLVTVEPEDMPGMYLITGLIDRTNYLVRKSPHKTAHKHIIAANVDQVIIMATLVQPRTSLGFIDRILVTAEAYDIPSVILFNKEDLLDNALRDEQNAITELYTNIGYSVVSSSVLNGSIENIDRLIEGKNSLITGHSGVGKSTLINRIVPVANQRTSEISTFVNKGVHTTTFAEMFSINQNTFLIDTPGIKEFGLIDITKDEIGHFFPEFLQQMGNCKFHNCAHVNEPGCAIIKAVESGIISISRYQSYLSMYEDHDNRR